MKQINVAAGTAQIKLGAGKVWGILGVSAGTSYTFQLKDGPDANGNVQIIYGQSAAVPVVAGVQYLNPLEPLTFRDGLQITVAGTPGDIELQYD